MATIFTKSIAFILFFAFFSMITPAQNYYQGDFAFQGKVYSISTSPDGTIWLPTEAGCVYRMKDLRTKPELVFNRHEEIGGGLTAPAFNFISFFSNETGIITGYISKKFYEDDKNKFYRTTNGWASWYVQKFPSKDVWVRSLCFFSNGKAWLAGSNGRILYTADQGATWKKLPKTFSRMKEGYYPHPDAWTISMLDDNKGIVGNRNNQLCITNDNFKHHVRIPTPLDQGLYTKAYKPYYLNGTGRKYVSNWAINKIKIFGKYYFLDQNDRVFFTPKDSIKWRGFEPNAIDIEVDAGSKILYVITKDLEVLILDSSLNLKVIGNKKLKDVPVSFATYDNGVFILVAVYYSGAKDKVVDETGTFVVIQKNARVLKYYCIYWIKGEVFEEIKL